MNEPDFWNDRNKSNSIISELNYLKKLIADVQYLKEKIASNLEMLELNDHEMNTLIFNDKEEIELKLDDLSTIILLNGPYDKYNAVIEIHPGAGGTESCDWANMLYRMYTRWCDKKGYKYEILDEQKGEEAGIKSATLVIYGSNIFGYLKNEKGVHRLVRISPFDSNARRHTSFASVDVTPYIEDKDIDIEINPNDIRVDVYRSSGCGGQGVNTTDSAVRITHFPSKIVVTCQNERSQIQNKEQAMKVLRARLFEAKQREQDEQVGSDRKNKIGTGDRSEKIRTYNYPQNRVTDHRIGYTTNTLDRCMNGQIEDLIEALINEDYKRKLEEPNE